MIALAALAFGVVNHRAGQRWHSVTKLSTSYVHTNIYTLSYNLAEYLATLIIWVNKSWTYDVKNSVEFKTGIDNNNNMDDMLKSWYLQDIEM